LTVPGKLKGVIVYFDLILVRIQRAVAIYDFGGGASGHTHLEVNIVRKATARA
jgi:hypothetical protein